MGDKTKILVLEVDSNEWLHPDFRGIIEKELLSAHGITVASVAYETAPSVSCEVASSAKIFQCSRDEVSPTSFCTAIKDNTIINASWGVSSEAEKETFMNVFRDLLAPNKQANDSVLVIAAGNKNRVFDPENPNFPNDLFLQDLLREYGNRIIVAGGITSSYADAKFIKPGSNIQLQKRFLCALAKDVPVRTGKGYGKASGTSLAAPAISGAIALIKSKYPRLSLSEIMNILLVSAIKFLPPEIGGCSVLSIDRALELAERKKNHPDKSLEELEISIPSVV